MAQRTAMDEFRAWLTPVLIGVVGYLLNNGINDLKDEINKLKEMSGTHESRIQRVEFKVFGISYSGAYLHPLQFIYDKTKTLHYREGVFYYA